jgi:general secretion pathway protein D
VRDPNPDLDGVISEIPEIQVREMETLLRMNSGQTAIIGGLMQDKVEKKETGIPWLNKIPAIGFLFGSTEETVTKTELLVFIKATVVDAASVDNELRDYYEYLPKKLRKDHLSPSERVAK